MSGFTVSQITKNRVDSIRGMLAPEVAEAIKKDLPATALAVAEDDTAIGALGGAVDGDAFEVVSIYVDPEYRRKGAGTALMKALFSLAQAEDLMVRAEYTPIDGEGESLRPFFRSLGFRQEEVIFPVYCIDSLHNFRLDPRSIPGSMSEILSFPETPEELLKGTELLKGEDQENDRLKMDTVMKELSFCAIKDEEITACLITTKINDGVVELTPLWEGDTDIRDVRLMLSFALEEIRKAYDGDTRIMIPVFETETRQIMEDFFGESAAATLSFVKSNFAAL